jgi:hypothetical protein
MSGHAGRAFPICIFQDGSLVSTSPLRDPCNTAPLPLPVSNLSTGSQFSSWLRSKHPRSAAEAANLARLVTTAAEQSRAVPHPSLTFVLAPGIHRDLAHPLRIPCMPQTMAVARRDEHHHIRNVPNLSPALEPSAEMARA